MSLEIDWNCEEAKDRDWCLYCNKYKEFRFYAKEPVKTRGEWSVSDDYFGTPCGDSWELFERPEVKTSSVEIEWDSEMAKGSNYCLVTKKGSITSFSFVKHVESALDEDTTIYERPKAEKQSVYTQEMYDAGELPKVGMKINVEVCGDEGKCELKEVVVISVSACKNPVITFLRNDECNCGYWHNGIHFKAVDQRTDKQKTIQKLGNRMKNIDVGDWSDDAECLLNEIINNEFEFIKYTGKDND